MERKKTPAEWKAEKEKKRKWREERLLKELEMKKRREESENSLQNSGHDESTENTGRKYTVSLALPGSILDNAQTPELRAYLAGQIARAAVVFNIDEIVIFNETGSGTSTVEDKGLQDRGRCNIHMARILQYLECPQYLRKSFFPMHKDLQHVGLINPLGCPHHLKAHEECPYREGVVTDKVTDERSFVEVGLQKQVRIDRKLQPGMRVTVQMDKYKGKKLSGKAVAPSAPRTAAGLYWGYNVRLASSLSAVFTQAPHDDGYDLTIGTSEKGSNVDEFEAPKFQHALVVFGGVAGLEASLEADEDLTVEEPRELFHHYLNTCPGQGSNTIRTEEAILISLSALRPKMTAAGTTRDTGSHS